MPASKAKVVETLAEVKNLGPTYAERAYDELGVRSIEDLIKAAEGGKLQEIKGIGAAKEKAILKSAKSMADAPAAPAKAETPKKATKTTTKKSDEKKAKSTPKKSADTKKSEPKKADTKKEAPKKEAPKKVAAKTPESAAKPNAASADASKSEAPKKPAAASSGSSSRSGSDRPRTTYRPPVATKSRPSIPGLLFKLTKKIIGRILS